MVLRILGLSVLGEFFKLLRGVFTSFSLGILIDLDPVLYESVENFNMVSKLIARFTGALVRANGNDPSAILSLQD